MIGNTGQSFPQFFFGHKLWKVVPQEPNQWWNVIGALMIRYKNQGAVFWKTNRIVELNACAKKTKAAYEKEIKVTNRFALCGYTKKMKTNHLNGMKEHK